MAVGARKYSIPFQIALLRSDGLACREIFWNKKVFFPRLATALPLMEILSIFPETWWGNLILAPAAPVNQEKQLFFQLFHPLFFYCFLNSFN
jgi:hypothetical protein